MQSELPKALVVEDDETWQRIYQYDFTKHAQVLIAPTHEKASELFKANQQDIVLIVMDGSLSGNELDTLGLVREFREAGFAGPMVAASSHKGYNQQLMDAGCSHIAGKPDDENAAEVGRRLLSTMKPAIPPPRDELHAYYESIIGPFRNVAQKLSVYYEAVGSGSTCGIANFLEFRGAGMGIDFVPVVARDGLEKMVQAAGISLHKNDGGGGKDAYFTFLREGMTPDKLNALANSIDAEVSRLKGPDFMEAHQDTSSWASLSSRSRPQAPAKPAPA